MEESWGTTEFKNCGVEDKREAKSIAAMADKLLEHPELAFSSAVGGALRKAAWRIFSKEEADISYGHYKQTSKRCAAQNVILVSQDTSDLSYPTHFDTEGLGDLGGSKSYVNRGICLHSALAITADGLPLGLIGHKLWAPVSTGKGSHDRKAPLEQKESYRWVEALQWVEEYLSGVEQVVIISDSESDFYEYLSAPRPANTALLLRVHHQHRYVYYLGKRVQLKEVCFDNAVTIPVLLPGSKKRKERTAMLEVSWGKVICPPAWGKEGKEAELWLVKAEELQAPLGERPIAWYLFSTLHVEEEATALLILDYYRKRWIIERWHLVLKDGLKVERLQFDCFRRLSNAISLLCIVAWQLLYLKHLAAQSPNEDAALVLEPEQLEILELKTGKSKLSMSQALVAIAALAGFTPSKKQPLPGEKTIWRGWAIFSAMCEGYKLVKQKSYGT